MKYNDMLGSATAEVQKYLNSGWLLLGNETAFHYDFRCDLLNPKTNETIRIALDFRSEKGLDVFLLIKVPTSGDKLLPPKDQFNNEDYLIKQFFCINYLGFKRQEQWFVETEAEYTRIKALQRERLESNSNWYCKPITLKPTEQLCSLLQSRLLHDRLKKNRNISISKSSFRVDSVDHMDGDGEFFVYISAPQSSRLLWHAYINKHGIFPQHV